MTTGFRASANSSDLGFDVALAPTFVYSQNEPFDIVPDSAPGRSTYSSPWHLPGPGSADLPLRFGDRAVRALYGGDSRVQLRVRNVAVGVTSADEWWGPGIRNALVLSDNAAGIPRAFVQLAHPARTPVGTFDAEYFVGTLTKSLFFDSAAASNYRGISGLRVSFRPAGDTNLTFGVARAVYVASSSVTPSTRAALNVLRWRPEAAGNDTTPADQIASVFGRWVFPASGFEVYGEFARMQLPRNLADLIQTYFRTSGFTLGFQWAVDQQAGRALRIQGEASALDQNLAELGPVPIDFYTGNATQQGYTQRGQTIGAAIGPGGSSEWLAVDEIHPRAQLGVFVGRIRWEEGALYRQIYRTFFSHDVSMLAGIRGGLRLPTLDVNADLTATKRFNYLFQNGSGNAGGGGTVNVINITLATRITAR